jgi:hypothetical protein
VFITKTALEEGRFKWIIGESKRSLQRINLQATLPNKFGSKTHLLRITAARASPNHSVLEEAPNTAKYVA